MIEKKLFSNYKEDFMHDYCNKGERRSSTLNTARLGGDIWPKGSCGSQCLEMETRWGEGDLTKLA